jgi:cytochrome c556
MRQTRSVPRASQGAVFLLLAAPAVLAAIGLASCTRTESPSAAASAPPALSAESPFRVHASIQELMQSVVDPPADALWDSVATISTASGIEERQPRTDEEWATVRRHAITLAEAANLLAMDGRRVAHEGQQLEDSHTPGIWTAEEIQKAIDGSRPEFIEHAHALQSAALAALAAIDTRDAEALSAAGGALDEACEQCHLKYWYPNTPRPTASQ